MKMKKMRKPDDFPFAAVVGQEQVKKAILIAIVNPRAGGLLLSGRRGTGKSVLARSTRALLGEQEVINLPLNITEDMLFGSIDIEYAVSRGEKRFAPGLLARAHENILYIDDANLLRQEILQAVLDANAAGFNRVERDGISFAHDVDLTVLASMNPEEGVLPGFILDRFGMFVNAEDIADGDARVEIIRRALAYAADARAFCQDYAQATQELAEKIARAKKLLPQIRPSESMLWLAAQLAAQANCAGQRGEIYLLEAARAAAALAGRTYLLPQDVQAAAPFVLAHRMRPLPEEDENEPRSAENPAEQNDAENAYENNAGDSDDSNNDIDSDINEDDPLPEKNPAGRGEENARQDEDEQEKKDDAAKNEQQDFSASSTAPEEKNSGIDKDFQLPPLVLELGKDNRKRRGSGKRSLTRTDLKQGRYVRAEMKEKVEDLAFDATIRAAAPLQKWREPNGCALNIKPEDLRQKVREKRIGNTFLFAVDASGSMGARERMRAVKGAICALLQEAYQKRDRVGMLAFRRTQAEVLLPVTRSVDLAQKCLAQLPTGGKTPLAGGLAEALQILARLRKQDSGMEPLLILVTDGRANASEAGEDPVEAALRMARIVAREKIPALVIDTESDFIKLGLAKRVAAAMNATYCALDHLRQENIIRIVRDFAFGKA